MGIFNALVTAVAGLQAQSFALNNISGNIANSQTIGYKRDDTAFADLVLSSAKASAQTAGSVRPLTQTTNSVQGNVQSSDVGTNMSINGDGYFLVGTKTATVDGNAVFSPETNYTRRGDFTLDKDGYLVNGSGYYLKALPVDLATGNPASDTPAPVRFSNDFLAAHATTTVTYHANLASFPLTAKSNVATPGSELLPTGTETSGHDITADKADTFLQNSVSGGAVTVYDANGQPVDMQLRWAKTADTAASGTTPASTTWHLYYQSNTSATGTGVAWTGTDQDYTFDSTGKLSPAVTSSTITGVTVNGTVIGKVTLQHDATGITQYADTNGTVQVNTLTQDGYSAGQVKGVTVQDGGHIMASYSNGQIKEVGRVVLASFNGGEALQKLDGGAYRQTYDSGPPILGATGTISGSSTEASNTDIATEFSKLIVTQQAYSANTRIVTTSDQMLQEVMQMKR